MAPDTKILANTWFGRENKWFSAVFKQENMQLSDFFPEIGEKKWESEIWSNPDIHSTPIPLKKVMESKENLCKISKVPEYFLCNTKKTNAKYKNWKFKI